MGVTPKDVPASPGEGRPQYALVAYVRDELGRFVEGLRSELFPEHSHLAAHITVLPPRVICRSEQDAISELRAALKPEAPFEVSLGDVESFFPTTPTVFIRVDGAAERFRQLHARLNTGAFCFEEQWNYVPHLTIVKMPGMPQAAAGFRVTQTRWAAFRGARRLRVQELTFVREDRQSNHWVDLASFPLQPVP